MIIEKINNSCIGYTDNCDIHIREYYNYCVSLIKERLKSVKNNINIILGNYSINFNNENTTIKIDIQCEHTIVSIGGRSINEIIYSELEPINNEIYLIRIDKYDYLNTLDCVIEYSLMNIENIKSKKQFNAFIQKITHISPLLYNIDFSNKNKTDVITLASNESNLRRINIKNKLMEYDIPYKNIENCFSKIDLKSLYDTTKILVNVHQTDHHKTFEELRVLPALLNGVLIVSEEVPYKEFIPYHEYIIWCEYDKIPEMVNKIYKNYTVFYNTTFNTGKLKEILNVMKYNNSIAFNNLLK